MLPGNLKTTCVRFGRMMFDLEDDREFVKALNFLAEGGVSRKAISLIERDYGLVLPLKFLQLHRGGIKRRVFFAITNEGALVAPHCPVAAFWSPSLQLGFFIAYDEMGYEFAEILAAFSFKGCPRFTRNALLPFLPLLKEGIPGCGSGTEITNYEPRLVSEKWLLDEVTRNASEAFDCILIYKERLKL